MADCLPMDETVESASKRKIAFWSSKWGILRLLGLLGQEVQQQLVDSPGLLDLRTVAGVLDND